MLWNFAYHPIAKTTNEQNLQPIFKLKFLFHSEINKFNHFLQPILILRGMAFSSEGGPNLQKDGIDKTATPHFCNKNFYDPHHRYTPYLNRLKLLKSVFLNKINTLSVILWHPTFWSSKILWAPIFLSKNLQHPVYLGPSPSKENASPLKVKMKKVLDI